ncbi:MAG: hypothetical protein KC766_01980 [Myxococcales bacterium]|nr:hypothetical protein [Myxococcales bacterium]
MRVQSARLGAGNRLASFVVGLSSLSWTASALALEGGQEAPAPAFEAKWPADRGASEARRGAEEDDEGIGLEIGVGAASAYAWRGLNIYAAESQHDQHGQIAPWISYGVPGTDLTLDYWSSYQTNGPNKSAAVDEGTGAEQDLTATYSFELSEEVSLEPFVSGYFYPFAKQAAAGVSNPTYVEPGVGVGYTTFVDFEVSASYIHGVQSELKDSRHGYLHVGLSKSVPLNDTFELSVGAGYGLKGYLEDAGQDNVHDVQLDAALAFSVDSATLAPGVHWVWTDLSGVGFSQEQFTYVGLDASYAF